MLKLVAALGLLFVVSSGEDVVVRPPGALSDEDKLKKVTMPTLEDKGLLQSVNPSKCLDKKIYHDMDTLLKVKEEKDYLCAYISYQANKNDGVGIPLYSSKEEATDRYNCFKDNVKLVNGINGANLTYTAELNKFSDMTPYEKNRWLGLGPLRKGLPDNCDSPADDADDATAKGVGKTADGAPDGGFGSSAGGAPGRGLGSSAGGVPGRGLGNSAGGAPARGVGNSAGGVPPRGLGMGAPGLRRRRDV